MPTVFRSGSYRFFFFSNEGTEPIHIHVERGNMYAKFWLTPISLARNHGFPGHEVRKLAIMVEQHAELIREKWHEHFSD